jgi:predicted kinase
MNELFTEKNLILIRGLPGSGKTSFAELLVKHSNACSYSVDDYFTTENGEYRFEFDKNHLAYKQCENNTEAAMQQGKPIIVVHNTFVYDWEMEPYLKLASTFNYRLFVLTTEKYHDRANTHAVTEEQIRKMAEKYLVKLF